MRASDIMTRQVITACPDDTVHEAAKKLLEAKVKRLPVVDDEIRVVGIVVGAICSPYLRTDEEIRTEITEDVILRTMSIDPKGIRVEVSDGLVHLHGRVDRRARRISSSSSCAGSTAWWALTITSPSPSTTAKIRRLNRPTTGMVRTGCAAPEGPRDGEGSGAPSRPLKARAPSRRQGRNRDHRCLGLLSVGIGTRMTSTPSVY